MGHMLFNNYENIPFLNDQRSLYFWSHWENKYHSKSLRMVADWTLKMNFYFVSFNLILNQSQAQILFPIFLFLVQSVTFLLIYCVT